MVTTGLRWDRKGPERAQAGRPGALGPAGLAHFGAQSVSVFFSTKYASTLIYVLPKPPTISAYKYPEAAVKKRTGREAPQRDRGDRREEHPEIHSS